MGNIWPIKNNNILLVTGIKKLTSEQKGLKIIKHWVVAMRIYARAPGLFVARAVVVPLPSCRRAGLDLV